MIRARLIYNPSAGRKEIIKKLYLILDALESYDIETSCYQTKGKCDAAKGALEAAEKGFDILIAAGGDGTLNEVINGISGLEKRPKIGIIPAGTTNDFAKAIGIPKDLVEAAKLIGEQNFRAIDIGRHNDKYFINVAAGGALTELTYEVPSKYKSKFGPLAYYVKSIEKLPFLKAIDISVETNDEVYNEKVMLFIIANSNSVGGFKQLIPCGDLTDALFDVIIVKKTNSADFLRIISLAARGEHLKEDKVIYFKASKINIKSNNDAPVMVNLDGELGGSLPGEFEILKNHIEIFMK